MFAKRILGLLGIYALCAIVNPIPAVADGHMSGEGEHHDGEHMGPPPPPPALAEAIEELIEEGDLSETASDMLTFLLMTPEERQEAEAPDFEEEVVAEAEGEIEQLFRDLLDANIDEEANGYLTMMLDEMSRAHEEGEHHDGEYHDGEGTHHEEGEHHEGAEGHDGYYCGICDLHFETAEEMDAHAEAEGHLEHHDGEGMHHEGEGTHHEGEGMHHEGEGMHHEGEHPDGFYCQICDLHFETAEEMDAHAEAEGHLEHHEGEHHGGYYCEICDIHFETAEEMDAHAEAEGHLEHHEGEHHEGEGAPPEGE